MEIRQGSGKQLHLKLHLLKYLIQATAMEHETSGYTAAQTLATFQQIGYGLWEWLTAKKRIKSSPQRILNATLVLGPANGTFNNAPGAIYIIDPTKETVAVLRRRLPILQV
jgi:hypothetical protein